jgi:hypothetical protein
MNSVCLLLSYKHTKRYVCKVKPQQENNTECSFYRDPEQSSRCVPADGGWLFDDAVLKGTMKRITLYLLCV